MVNTIPVKLIWRLTLLAVLATMLYLGFHNYIHASNQKFLDLFPGARVAYALHQLSSDYTGPLVRVRRGSDHATLDVGFNINGELSISDIENFSNALSPGALPGTTSAFDIGYSVRRINSGYLGSALRLRRVSGGEIDIGFDADGNLDLAAVDNFLDDELLYNDTLPLDTAPGASAAYSVRKLSSSYDGPAMRIRRVSDDAEIDISFAGSGDLDYISINNYCSGTDCTVVTWYDQSGSLRDATQSDTDKQPLIYDDKLGLSFGKTGQIALDFLQTSLEAPCGFDITTDNFSWFMVAESTDENWLAYFSTESFRYLTNEFRMTAGGSGNPRHMRRGEIAINSVFYDGVTYSNYLNNSLRATSTTLSAVTPSNTLYIGYNATGVGSESYLVGKISELIFYDSDVSANRDDVSGNEAKYYSIGINEGFVTTLYDQSNNAHHATNIIADEQPLLVYKEGQTLLPAHQAKLKFYNGRHLDFPATTNGLTLESTFMVADRTSFSQSFFDLNDSAARSLGFGINTSNTYYDDYYNDSQYFGDSFNDFVTFDRRVIASGFGANTIVNNAVLGNTHGPGSDLDGHIQELIFYVADQAANRFVIENNMNIYFKLSANNIYVDTWYDQSGNGINASQANTDIQPLIYSADTGMVLNDGNKATMRFGLDRLRSQLLLTLASPISTPYSIITYGAAHGTQGTHRDTFYQGVTNAVTFAVNPSTTNDDEIHINSGSDLVIHYLRRNWDKDNLYFHTFGSEASAYANGDLIGSGDSGNWDLHDLNIGNKGGSNYNYLNGTISELIIYPDDKTSSKSNIENYLNVRNDNEFFQDKIKAAILKKKARRNFARHSLIKKKKTFVKLDKDNSRSIDYNELVDTMFALHKAKYKGNSAMNLSELAAVDVDENHTFNNNDERLMRKVLKVHPRYDYIDSMFAEELSFNANGDFNLKSASNFIKSYRKKKKQLQRLKKQGLITATSSLPEEFSSIDCNKDSQISRQDKICASDLLRNVLMKSYPKQKTMKFLKKNKFNLVF